MENNSQTQTILSKIISKTKYAKLNISSFLAGLILGVALVVVAGSGFVVSEIANSLNKQPTQSSTTLPDLTSESASCKTESFSKDNAEVANKECSAYLKFKEIKAAHIPTGVPAVYGEELNISFDQVQDAINKVRVFGPDYGEEGKKIILAGQELERYINIDSQTACEYCCGAKALIRKDGTAACGCAHSTMMRGLSAYLIKNHPELSNAQILNELNTWKITFFPKQTLIKKLSDMEKAGEPGIKDILEEFPEFLPQMVGGC